MAPMVLRVVLLFSFPFFFFLFFVVQFIVLFSTHPESRGQGLRFPRSVALAEQRRSVIEGNTFLTSIL